MSWPPSADAPSEYVTDPPTGRRRPGFLWRLRDEFALTVGIVLMLLWLLFFAACISLSASSEADKRENGIFGIFFFTAMFGFPAAVFIGLGINWRRKQRKLNELADYLRMRRETPLSELAQALGLNQIEAATRLRECQELELVAGRIDPERVVFVCEG